MLQIRKGEDIGRYLEGKSRESFRALFSPIIFFEFFLFETESRDWFFYLELKS